MVQTKKPSILLLFLVVATCNFVGQAVMSSSVNENNNEVSKVAYSDVNDKNIIVSDLTDKSQINSIVEESSLSTDTIKELKTTLDDTEIDNLINDN